MPDVGLEIQVRVRSTAVQRALLAAPKALFTEERKAVKDIMSRFKRDMVQQRLSVGGDRRELRGGRGLGLRARSGRLRRGFKTQVEGTTLPTLVGKAGWFDAQLARIASVHEFGTRGYGGPLPSITPKRAKYLTVPLPKALTAAGRLKGEYRNIRNRRDVFAVFKRGKDSGVLMVRRGRGGAIPIFALRKRVDLRPLLGMQRLWNSATFAAWRIAKMRAAVDRALRKSGR